MFKLKVEHFILFKLFNQVEGVYFYFLRFVEFSYLIIRLKGVKMTCFITE